MSWDPSTPLGSDFISLGDDQIRAMKADLQTALRGDEVDGTVAKFPGADAANPVYAYRGRKDTTANRPAATDEGLFFDTTRNALQRSNGTTYDDVGTLIPAGTAMVFYQASAPVGWTAVAVNDKFLRVVTAGGTGGTTGGTVGASTSLAHSHTVASHTHAGPSHTHSTPNHVHELDYTVTGSTFQNSVYITNYTLVTDGDNARFRSNPTAGGPASGTYRDHTSGTQNSGGGTSGAGGTEATGAATPGTDSQLGVLAYADVVVATKD